MFFELYEGEGPLAASAIHNGHSVRREVEGLLAITEKERMREEDPYTGDLTRIANTRIIVHKSRFEVDLNRKRDKAVYLSPEDAWGLRVWKTEPSPETISASLSLYDSFYNKMEGVFSSLREQYGCFVVLDLHTYNHRRLGPDAPPDEPSKNPEVNIGTGTLDRQRWAYIIDSFMDALSSFNFLGRRLDVRENVKFLGGHFVQWINSKFPDHACAIAVEIKKFFMDEWGEKVDNLQLGEIYKALQSASCNITEEIIRHE